MTKMKKRPDVSPKLKAMVENFKKAHKMFCDALVQVAYRLAKEAAQIGNMLLDMQKEGKFKTKGSLRKWLDGQVEHKVPRSTFYRYINAAEWWKEAEIVHGKEALTDDASLKTLKLLANPRVEFEAIDEGWAKKGDAYTQTIQGIQCKILHPIGKKPTLVFNGKTHSSVGSLKEACTIAAETAARLAQQPDGSDPNDEGDEEKNPQANGTPQHITCFHHDCRNFQIDCNSLQCLDQQGQRIILVTPKKQRMADLLKDTLKDGLAAIAKGHYFIKLKKDGKTTAMIAKDLALSHAEVRRHLHLLRLEPEEQHHVAEGQLTLDAAYELLAKRMKEKPSGEQTAAKPKATKRPAKKRRAAK